jgi:hypothetical protein
MTRKEALAELIAKVEAGRIMPAKEFEATLGTEPVPSGMGYSKGMCAWQAHNGSLDAAKALHDAVLPDWAIERLVHWPGHDATVRLWGTHEKDGGRWHRFSDGKVNATASTLTRAWLLAILRALHALEENAEHAANESANSRA